MRCSIIPLVCIYIVYIFRDQTFGVKCWIRGCIGADRGPPSGLLVNSDARRPAVAGRRERYRSQFGSCGRHLESRTGWGRPDRSLARGTWISRTGCVESRGARGAASDSTKPPPAGPRAARSTIESAVFTNRNPNYRLIENSSCAARRRPYFS